MEGIISEEIGPKQKTIYLPLSTYRILCIYPRISHVSCICVCACQALGIDLFCRGRRRWPVAGGRWPVAGRRWALGRGRWPLVGRWPVAGGRWVLGGDRWPVAAGRWPVAAGRWLSVKPLFPVFTFLGNP